MISSCGACAHYDGRYLHLLALGLEERDPEDIFSHQINLYIMILAKIRVICILYKGFNNVFYLAYKKYSVG